MEFGATLVGVNTGTAIVGNSAAANVSITPPMGTPSTPQRGMEGVNKHLGTLICISGTTVAQVPASLFRPWARWCSRAKPNLSRHLGAHYRGREQNASRCAVQRGLAHLERGAADAAELFAALRAISRGPLVTLHYDRVAAGTLSATIILAEK